LYLYLLMKVLGWLEGVPVLEHTIMRNTVLDGDNYILHFQVRQQHHIQLK
jgi:hypothetical protein